MADLKANSEFYATLEDIHFKYERICALVGCLRILVAEGLVDIIGLPENTIDYSLYEIENELYKNNNILKELISEGKII